MAPPYIHQGGCLRKLGDPKVFVKARRYEGAAPLVTEQVAWTRLPQWEPRNVPGYNSKSALLMVVFGRCGILQARVAALPG